VNIKYFVELTAEEREQLLEITSNGRQPARVVKRANILLMADGWQHSDNEISDALSAGTSTVYRIKRDFVEYVLDVYLQLFEFILASKQPQTFSYHFADRVIESRFDFIIDEIF
jgi:hypothetical protein